MRLPRWIGTSVALACVTIALARADEGPPPAQQHSAEACGEDAQCLKLWYAEYKDAIIQELLFWRTFEDDVSSHNSLGAEHDLNFAIEKKQYKHNHWDFYRGVQFQAVGQRELETLTVSCRDAIISMKFMLLNVSEERPLMEGDQGEYLDKVRACERQFKLPRFTSRLRG
jgi:hypothetical protein